MPKSKKASLEDIAERCGLCRATVGHILSGQSRYKFKKSTAELVHRVAEELHYRPNPFASTLRTQENKIILCIVGDTCRYSDVEHLKGLEYELGRRGYNLLIQFLVGLTDEKKLEFIRNLINFPAGIAIWSLGFSDQEKLEEFRRIFENAPPTLGLCSDFPGTQIDYIRVMWGASTTDLIVKHFAKKKFKRIACCCTQYDQDLLKGSFLSESRKYGLETRFYSDSIASYQYFELGKKIAAQLLREKNFPDGIYCPSDETALSLIEEFRGHGINVPEDVYILGGGDSGFRSYLQPPLPVMVHDISKLCQTGAEDLVTRIERGDQTVGTGRCIAEIGRRVYEI